MSDPNAEREVKRLARLEKNTVCPNCGVTKAKFGFSTVCIKFHTFVCNDCKSSHQAISHRCKSLTMSSWSASEVAELKKKGNDFARQTWLANAPPVGQNGRPSAGASLAVYKNFVVDAYERKKYYGNSGTVSISHGDNDTVSVVKSTKSTPLRTKTFPRKKTTETKQKALSTPPPKPQPVVEDLLSFDFDNDVSTKLNPHESSTVTTVSSQTTATSDLFSGTSTITPKTTNSSNFAFDPFGNNSAVTNPPLSAPSDQLSSLSLDDSTKSSSSSLTSERPIMNSVMNNATSQFMNNTSPQVMNNAFTPQQQQQMMMQQQMLMQQKQQQGMMNNMMFQQQAAMNMMQQQQQAMMMNNVGFRGSLNGNINVPQTYSSSRKDDPFAGL